MAVKLVISIDVEEDGLFSGMYRREPPGVSNVAALDRLEFVSREFGLPLTLLVTYPVLGEARSRDLLARWRNTFGAEIGAHLHPWATPPYQRETRAEPVPARLLAPTLLRDKISSLVSAIESGIGAAPTAFRMGRFDDAPTLAQTLVEAGFLADSSVVPFSTRLGRGHMFRAPRDPYVLLPGDVLRPPLVEVPLTMATVSLGLAAAAFHASGVLPDHLRWRWLDRFRYVGVVGVHPAWYLLPAMKACARLHRRCGGRVFNVFLHSSELMPGATPMFRTEAAVGRVVDRLRAWLTWLLEREQVEGLTLSQVATRFRQRPLPECCRPGGCGVPGTTRADSGPSSGDPDVPAGTTTGRMRRKSPSTRERSAGR